MNKKIGSTFARRASDVFMMYKVKGENIDYFTLRVRMMDTLFIVSGMIKPI